MPAAFGGDADGVDRVTATFVADLFTGGDFDAGLRGGDALLDERERSHMRDVGRLVRALAALDLVALAVTLAAGWGLRRERRRRGTLLLVAAGVVGAVALLVAILFAVAFETAFLAFHQLFFAEGTFLFQPGSDLIRLFPPAFWFEASLVAGATIVLSALAVGVLGWRERRH